MTQNQLRYWELRWKQFYDMRQLEIDKAKLELEVDKLLETIRHNKVGERQEKQRIILERQKLSKEWAVLNETIRSNIINEGINAYKALETERHNMSEESRKYIELLGNQAIALGDLMVQAETAKNKNTTEFIKAYGDGVGEFLKAFGGGLAATGLGELRASLGASNYDAIIQATIDQFPQFKGVLTTQGTAGTVYSTDSENSSNVGNTYVEHYGPSAQSQLEKDVKDKLKYPHDFSESGLVQGFSQTQVDSSSSDIVDGVAIQTQDSNSTRVGSTKNVVQEQTPSGTSIIYSPGSHYGPGF